MIRRKQTKTVWLTFYWITVYNKFTRLYNWKFVGGWI